MSEKIKKKKKKKKKPSKLLEDQEIQENTRVSLRNFPYYFQGKINKKNRVTEQSLH